MSRDIVFMEDRTIADWELEKKIADSRSTSRDRLKEIRTYPDGGRMALEEPARFEQKTEST